MRPACDIQDKILRYIIRCGNFPSVGFYLVNQVIDAAVDGYFQMVPAVEKGDELSYTLVCIGDTDGIDAAVPN